MSLRAHALSENKLLNKREDYDQHHRNMQKVLGLTCLTDTILADPANRLLQVGLRARPNFNRIKEAGGIVVGLTCPIELCLPRIDQTNPKNPKTYQEYAEALAIEASSDAYGTHTSWCIENADYTLDTAKPIEETHSEIDRIISHYDG